MYRKRVDPLGSISHSPPSAPWSSLLSSSSLHGVPRHSFITIAHIASCRRTLTDPRISLASEGIALSRNTYESLVFSFGKWHFKPFLCQKMFRPRVPSGAQTKTSPQSNAYHVPKNGQARRRPVELPGSNTRGCLDFDSKAFIFQKLLYVAYWIDFVPEFVSSVGQNRRGSG